MIFPDFAEPVIGRRFAPTRWLHPGYRTELYRRALKNSRNSVAASLSPTAE